MGKTKLEGKSGALAKITHFAKLAKLAMSNSEIG